MMGVGIFEIQSLTVLSQKVAAASYIETFALTKCLEEFLSYSAGLCLGGLTSLGFTLDNAILDPLYIAKTVSSADATPPLEQLFAVAFS